jgi:hypothetical protein
MNLIDMKIKKFKAMFPDHMPVYPRTVDPLDQPATYTNLHDVGSMWKQLGFTRDQAISHFHTQEEMNLPKYGGMPIPVKNNPDRLADLLEGFDSQA